MPDTKVNVLPEIPESIDNAFKNVTDLPTKGIGQTLSDCWFLAFGGISHLAEKRRAKYTYELTQFKKELEESLATVPDEYKKEPSTQIVLKALEEVKYCVEEKTLRDLFNKLLTSSTDIRKTVHPSFAYIISQMSSNDAKILECFKSADTLPVCDLKLFIKDSDGFVIIAKNIFINGSQSLSEEEKTISISSLLHLGLVEIPWDLHLTDETSYSDFYNTETYLTAKNKHFEHHIEIDKKLVKLTPLGTLFISSCLPDNVIDITN